jgi:hypothetical protein
LDNFDVVVSQGCGDILCKTKKLLNTLLQRRKNIIKLNDWGLVEFSLAIELFKKYVQKRKLRANFLKIEITTSQGAKDNFAVVLKQIESKVLPC